LGVRTHVLRIPAPVVLEPEGEHQAKVSFSAGAEWIEAKSGAKTLKGEADGGSVKLEIQGAREPIAKQAPQQIKIAPGGKLAGGERTKLGPGKYEFHLTLTLVELSKDAISRHKLPAAAMPEPSDAPFWTGKIELAPLPFELSDAQYAMDPDRAAEADWVIVGRMYRMKMLQKQEMFEGVVRVLSTLKGEGIKEGADINVRLTKEQNRDKGMLWYLVKGEDGFYVPAE
jgi:hypothetical protein